MSTRRVPLSSNQNAVNSPCRPVTAASSKPKRSYATVQREEAYGQPPPAKKQIVEASQRPLKTPPPQPARDHDPSEEHVFSRRAHARQPTSFERLLDNARGKPAANTAAEKAERAAEDNMAALKKWQRHYRKVFPKFVFYFDNIPEDVRYHNARLVAALGAVSACLCCHGRCRCLLYIARRDLLFERRDARRHYSAYSHRGCAQPSRLDRRTKRQSADDQPCAPRPLL